MGGQFSKYEFHSESFDVFINDDFANDGKIFYADTSPPPRAPLESDTGWIRALVGCIGGLGLFIPGAGPYIFGAASVTLLGLELSDEQKRNHPNYGQLKNDYDEMEKAVHKAIHDSQEQSIKTFDISMTQMINNWDKAGHFNLADLASENTMKVCASNEGLKSATDLQTHRRPGMLSTVIQEMLVEQHSSPCFKPCEMASFGTTISRRPSLFTL